MLKGTYVIHLNARDWGVGQILKTAYLSHKECIEIDFLKVGIKTLVKDKAIDNLRIVDAVFGEILFESRLKKKVFNRVTYCFHCKAHLETVTHSECTKCSWLQCKCGACGCSFNYIDG